MQSLDAGRGIDINDPSTDSPEVALDLSELLTTSTIGTSDSLAVSINSNDENRLISKHDFAVSIVDGTTLTVAGGVISATGGAAGTVTGIDAGDGIRVDDPTTATPEVNVDLFDLTMISTLQGSDVFGVGDDSNATDRTRGVTVEDHTAHLVTGNNGLGVDTGGNGVLEFALTELSGLTAMAAGDSFLVWDTSDSDAKRITRTNLAASMDGPGLIASSGNLDLNVAGLTLITTLQGTDRVPVMDNSHANDATRGITFANFGSQLADGVTSRQTPTGS